MNYITTGSELTSIANAIRVKGGTTEPLTYPSEFVSAIEAIPTGGGGVVEENDVNFIDYDGTLLYSYSANEFLALSAMPDNPEHEGLTAQGWNWSLADAKSYVQSHGVLNVGQMYTPTDGKLHIFITLSEEGLSPYLGLGLNGSAVIDWGDGSPTETLTGTNVSSLVGKQHTWVVAGDYEITVDITGSASILGGSNLTCLLAPSLSIYLNTNEIHYSSCIKSVWLTSNIILSEYAFQACFLLSSVVIPKGIITFGNYAFRACYALKTIVFPDTVTSVGMGTLYDCHALNTVILPNSVITLGSNAFYDCYGLNAIVIPDSVTSISSFSRCFGLQSVIQSAGLTELSSSAFYICNSLFNITIPNSVTSIGSNALANCFSLRRVKFEGTIPPTITASNAFNGLPTYCKIYVPTGSLSAYTTATNYPSSSTYTYVEY